MVSNLHNYFLFYGGLLFFMPHPWHNFGRQFFVDFIYFPIFSPFHINTETKLITYLHISHKKLSVRLQLHKNSHNSSFLTTVFYSGVCYMKLLFPLVLVNTSYLDNNFHICSSCKFIFDSFLCCRDVRMEMFLEFYRIILKD